MAQILTDRRDIDFVLYEQFDVEEFTRHEKFQDFNKKTFDLIIKEARNLAVKEILPTYAEGDREGVKFENGRVAVPACYHRPYQLLREGEWTSMIADPELGGQGLPRCIAQAASEYLVGANYALTLYGYLGHSAGELIEYFGTEKQRKLFLKKMYTGQWCGTMQLTEPQAGSDVGALTTSAVKNPDGTYSLTGSKIFITAGDHDLTENIIHPVLARIEGAPPGTKGISLFLVPKIWVNDDGSLGEPNDIICTGIEEKMGIHGSATCQMSLGSKGNCRGLLLGEENKGMRVMFHMMNAARLDVGFIGFICGSAAYMYALNYAKPFLDVTGDVCLAWMHLWRATIAAPKLGKLAGSLDPAARRATAAKNKEAAFYESVLQSARFYINAVLPTTMGNMNAIQAGDAAAIEIPEASFGG